jgi:hypothetical protein
LGIADFLDCGLTIEIGDLGLRLGIWDLGFGDFGLWGIINDSGAQFRNTIQSQQSQSSIPITNRQSQSAVSIANRQSQSSINNRRIPQSAVRSLQ